MSAPRNAVEERYAEKRGALPPARRLGCQAQLCGDVSSTCRPESQVHRQVVRKRAATHPIEIDPVVRLHYVEVAEPDMHDPASDFRRLCDALRASGSSTACAPHRPSSRCCRRRCVPAQWRVTVAMRLGREIVAIWPGSSAGFGVAVDIGSTTIAAHLCDLTTGEVLASAGRDEPADPLGEDLMSRVSYVMMNPGGERELTEAVRGALDADRRAGDARPARAPADILEMVVVGNPIMHHLFLGLDPTELGGRRSR
jgi:uncharacterized 2Fe-2S/4Fe-4S cluster protein (DUF4445 family)